MQMKGKVNVNDDARLEKEADVMGQKALNQKIEARREQLHSTNQSETIQRAVGIEFESEIPIYDHMTEDKAKGLWEQYIKTSNTLLEAAEEKMPVN